MNYVTDTHALVWWFIDSPKITLKVREIFERCEKGKDIIFIPSIVIAEALSIFEKQRVVFDFKRLLKKIDESEHFVIVAFDYTVLQTMLDFRDIPELHDKIIASTAKYLDVPIITKDRILQAIPYLKTLW